MLNVSLQWSSPASFPNLPGLCIRRVRVQTVVESRLSLALPLWQAQGGMPTVFSNADQAPCVCCQPDCWGGGVIDFLSSAEELM